MRHEIEIPELPKGWKAVAYRRPIMNVDYILLGGDVILCDFNSIFEYLIIEKIPPRRVVLEETDEVRRPKYGEYFREGLVDSKVELCTSHNYEHAVRIWREIVDDSSTVEEGERSSTTFRERVINDLVHNRIISEGG